MAFDLLPRLTSWGEANDAVRAVLLTSSRANPHRTVDLLSDYDVILAVREVLPFYEDRSWLEAFGEVLVAYWDPIEPAPGYDLDQVGNVIHYHSGLHIDFTVWPVELLRQIAAAPALPADLDDGYRVLLDKDHLTAGMQPPSYGAFVPEPPSEAEFLRTVEEFFSDVPYVAKCLWRDELMPARWCLDHDMKQNYLRPMLEWRMEIDHQWSAPTGVLGRGLKKRLPPEIWQQVERTYAGAAIAGNWDALFTTIALFGRVAEEVAQHLGYDYPAAMEEAIVAYAARIQRLPPP